jgi:hypothetical protein
MPGFTAPTTRSPLHTLRSSGLHEMTRASLLP